MPIAASTVSNIPIAGQADEMDERRKAAQDKLVALVRSYPTHTPPDHILFGYGGRKIYLSDMWDLLSLNR